MRVFLLSSLLAAILVPSLGCEKKRKEVVEEVGSQPKKVLDAVKAKTDAMVKKRAEDADEAIEGTAPAGQAGGGW